MIKIGTPPVAATTQQIEQLKTDMNLGLAWQMDGLEPTLRDGVGNPCELANFIGNTLAYRFVPGSVMEAFVNWDVPLQYASGTDLYASIHWSPGGSTNVGNVRWGIEFVGGNVNSTFNLTPQYFYILGAATGTAWLHVQSVSDPYPSMFVEPNKRFLMRLFRDGAHVDDTFPDDAYMIGIDFYYQTDRSGRNSITPPYV